MVCNGLALWLLHKAINTEIHIYVQIVLTFGLVMVILYAIWNRIKRQARNDISGALNAGSTGCLKITVLPMK